MQCCYLALKHPQCTARDNGSRRNDGEAQHLIPFQTKHVHYNMRHYPTREDKMNGYGYIDEAFTTGPSLNSSFVEAWPYGRPYTTTTGDSSDTLEGCDSGGGMRGNAIHDDINSDNK